MNVKSISCKVNQYSYSKDSTGNNSNVIKNEVYFSGAESFGYSKLKVKLLNYIIPPSKLKLYNLTKRTHRVLKSEIRTLQKSALKMTDEILAFKETAGSRIEEVLADNNIKFMGKSWNERVKGLNYEQRDRLFSDAIAEHGSVFTSPKYPDLKFEVNYYSGEFLEAPYPFISKFEDKNVLDVIDGNGSTRFKTKNADYVVDGNLVQIETYSGQDNIDGVKYKIYSGKVNSIDVSYKNPEKNYNGISNYRVEFNKKGKPVNAIFNNLTGEIFKYNL